MEETFSEIWLPHYVSYGETDAMGVVYYAEYIHLFERARGALCREAGIGYGKIEEAGFMPRCASAMKSTTKTARNSSAKA